MTAAISRWFILAAAGLVGCKQEPDVTLPSAFQAECRGTSSTSMTLHRTGEVRQLTQEAIRTTLFVDPQRSEVGQDVGRGAGVEAICSAKRRCEQSREGEFLSFRSIHQNNPGEPSIVYRLDYDLEGDTAAMTMRLADGEQRGTSLVTYRLSCTRSQLPDAPA